MTMISIKRFLMIIPIAIVLASCGNGPVKERDAEEEKPTQETSAELLELKAAQLKAVGITIGSIEEKNLTAVVKSSGQLAVPPQNEAEVNVFYGGIIRQISAVEGQKVHKGQVLLVIENPDMIKLQQEYLSVKNGFSYVSAEYKRQQLLKEAGAGTGKSQELAEANYNAERSKLKGMEKQLSQMGVSADRISKGNLVSSLSVLAPINGTVGSIHTMTGSFAQPGTALMDIVDNSKIHADLVVFEKDLSRIKVGQKVNFQLTNQKDQQIAGRIYGINKSFENDSKGVVVHAIIEKPGSDLIPGMYVTGLISVGSSLTLAVPVEAVIQSEGKKYLFLVVGEAGGVTRFKKFEVATGVSELGYIQITPIDKFPENPKVVKKGAFYLQSKAAGGEEE